MDIIDLVGLVPTRDIAARREVRAPFCCKWCGFTGVMRAIGLGVARGSGFTDTSYVEEEAHAKAAVDGERILGLVVCPQCRRRDPMSWAHFQRLTRLFQGITAMIAIAVIALAMYDRPNAIVGGVLAFVGVFAVLAVGFLRGLAAETAETRITFVSDVQLAREAEQAAMEAAERERIKRIRREEREARANAKEAWPRKRKRFG